MRLEIDALTKEKDDLSKIVLHPLFSSETAEVIFQMSHYRTFPGLQSEYEKALFIKSRIKDITETIAFLRKKPPPAKQVYIRSESKLSDSSMMEGLVTNDYKQEVMSDAVGTAENVIDINNSRPSQDGQRELTKLNDFFARPILISEGTIPLGFKYWNMMQVWDLYTLNPAVRGKLRNYAFLRANMHIRIVTTGTPFHYGKLLWSYQPYQAYNTVLDGMISDSFTFSDLLPLLTNYLSQSDGSIYVDVKENKPVELIIPYVSHKPMFRLFNTTQGLIGDTTSFDDLKDAGALILKTITTVNGVNTTQPVTYQVYAWLENVSLGCPTGQLVSIRAESKMEDEREVGPLEKIASNARSISDMLLEAPIIGPFAKASSITFSALESLSALFGWSKPVLIDAPHLMKNMPFQNGAHTVGYDTNYRITLDPKQELSVDPRVVGIDKDEMVISDIAARQTYLTSFSWTADQVPYESMFMSFVEPTLDTCYHDSTRHYAQPTAMSFAVSPFYYWRGSIEFTFSFCVSAFHRGKIAVWYEPNAGSYATTFANLNFNKQYMQILDLQDAQSITMCIDWHQANEYCVTRPNTTVAGISYTATGSTFTFYDNIFYNGVICMAPVTYLTSPDGSAVDVIVSVCCPDLKVNRLTNLNFPTNRILQSSGGPSIVAESRLDSQSTSCFNIAPSTAKSDHIALQHFGENPVSFRALLKRYVNVRRDTLGANVPASSVSDAYQLLSIWPPNYAPLGITTTLSNRDLFSYLRYAFMACRGGMRYRHYFTSLAHYNDHAMTNVSLLNPGPPVAYSDNVYAPTIGSPSPVPQLDGAVTFDPNSNGGVEVEIPFYNSMLYAYSFSDNMYGSPTGADGNYNSYQTWNYQISYPVVNNTTSAQPIYASTDFATGEDFMFMRYIAAPFYTVATPE